MLITVKKGFDPETIDPRATEIIYEGLGSFIYDESLAKELAQLSKIFPNLESLAVPNLLLKDVPALVSSLPNFKNLQRLDLGYGTFDNKTIKALCEALPKLKNLKSLEMGSCKIGGEDNEKLLAATLPKMNSLRRVIFIASICTKEGVNAVAEALPKTLITSIGMYDDKSPEFREARHQVTKANEEFLQARNSEATLWASEKRSKAPGLTPAIKFLVDENIEALIKDKPAAALKKELEKDRGN